MKKIFLIVTAIIVLVSCASNQEVYEWKNNDRSGIYDETNLLKEWPAEGPEELWTIEGLGRGFGSPTFTEDRFYITGEKDTATYLYCYNLDGERIWESRLGKEWIRTYPGSRSAPTIAGNHIYIVNGYGNLYCASTGDGSIIWSKDCAKDFQMIPVMHGMSEASIIDGDKVYYTPGGLEHNVVALNRFNGDLIWTCKGKGERAGYNQGNLIEYAGKKIFITFSAYHMLGIDAENGELLWSHEQDNTTPETRKLGLGDTHCNCVIHEGEYLYYQAGDGNCGVKLKLSEDGSSISEVWRSKRFDGYMGGIIKVGDYLYGSSGSKPDLLSIDASTGLTVDSLRIGGGALIGADNMFYYYEQRGLLHLVAYENGKMEDISKFRIKKGEKEHFAHPVINNGILYQRHGDVMMAYDIREKK